MDVAGLVVVALAGAFVALVASKAIPAIFNRGGGDAPPSRPPPQPLAADVLPLLALVHDQITSLSAQVTTIRTELADTSATLSMAQDTRETLLLKQINDLHDRIMVIMSPAFLREFRRGPSLPVSPQERHEILRQAGQREERDRPSAAGRRINYPGYDPDLRPKVVPGVGIDDIVETERAARRGVAAESFDDLPDDRSGDILPDAHTAEGAIAVATRARR